MNARAQIEQLRRDVLELREQAKINFGIRERAENALSQKDRVIQRLQQELNRCQFVLSQSEDEMAILRNILETPGSAPAQLPNSAPQVLPSPSAPPQSSSPSSPPQRPSAPQSLFPSAPSSFPESGGGGGGSGIGTGVVDEVSEEDDLLFAEILGLTRRALHIPGYTQLTIEEMIELKSRLEKLYGTDGEKLRRLSSRFFGEDNKNFFDLNPPLGGSELKFFSVNTQRLVMLETLRIPFDDVYISDRIFQYTQANND